MTTEETARCVQARAWGNGGDATVVPALIKLLMDASPQVRQEAVEALGALAGYTAGTAAINALQPLLRDPSPGVRQATLRSLASYGTRSRDTLADLRDAMISRFDTKSYRREAERTLDIIQEALRIENAQAEHLCRRCREPVQPDEYARNLGRFRRVFCDACRTKSAKRPVKMGL